MIGYAFNIILTVGASTFNVANCVSDENNEMYKHLWLTPMFPFTRIFYILTDHCAFQRCITRWDAHPEEIFTLIKVMYVQSVIYFLIAMYLYEIVPQRYGVPKHPLYFLEGFVIRNFPHLHPKIFTDESDLETYKDEEELELEDQDAKDEREQIYKMDK